MAFFLRGFLYIKKKIEMNLFKTNLTICVSAWAWHIDLFYNKIRSYYKKKKKSNIKIVVLFSFSFIEKFRPDSNNTEENF